MCAQRPLTDEQPLCTTCQHDLAEQLNRRRQSLLRLPSLGAAA